MNNAKFIADEFSHVSEFADVEYKPSLQISAARLEYAPGQDILKTKHISITWQQFEQIKRYLIDSEKDN